MDNGMHMIWHNHKAGTGTGLTVQLSYKIMVNVQGVCKL
jgi:hypothetical protein